MVKTIQMQQTDAAVLSVFSNSIFSFSVPELMSKIGLYALISAVNEEDSGLQPAHCEGPSGGVFVFKKASISFFS